MTMKTTRRHLAAGLAGIALLAALAAVLVGCGGGSAGLTTGVAAGGGKAAAAPAGPPLDFSFHPPQAPLLFSVDVASEAEVAGTSYISNLRYQWEARDWKQEGEDWACTIRFSQLSAGMRSGGGMAMASQDAVKRLEGFSTSYRKTKAGIKPVTPPAKDKEFLAIFNQLQGGLAPLDLRVPEATPRIGDSWQLPMEAEALKAMRGAMRDSMITYTYVRDESYQGRSCARLQQKAKIELDGLVTGSGAGEEEGSALVRGRIEMEASGLYDKAQGILVQQAIKLKFVINQREANAKGEATGAEQSIVQNLNLTIKQLGG
jgi:hypothetical protein